MEGTCLFVGRELLHRVTPQWTGTGHQCHSLISLQPVNCLTDAISNGDIKRSYAAWMNSRGVGFSSVEDPTVAQKPSPISFISLPSVPYALPHCFGSLP